MMDPKEFKFQAVKDAKCKLILDAADKVFGEKGIRNARMEDIAAVAGFSKPSLYNYYTDKESIVICLAMREFEQLGDKISSVVSQELPFVESIEMVYRIILKHFADKFSLFLDIDDYIKIAVANLNSENQNDLKNRFHEAINRSLGAYNIIIKRGRKNGEISSPIPDDVLSQMLMVVAHSVHMKWKMQGKADDVDTAALHLVEFIKNGFSITTGTIKPQTGK
jgi:AcrR family transcriptional regulator